MHWVREPWRETVRVMYGLKLEDKDTPRSVPMTAPAQLAVVIHAEGGDLAIRHRRTEGTLGGRGGDFHTASGLTVQPSLRSGIDG